MTTTQICVGTTLFQQTREWSEKQTVRHVSCKSKSAFNFFVFFCFNARAYKCTELYHAYPADNLSDHTHARTRTTPKTLLNVFCRYAVFHIIVPMTVMTIYVTTRVSWYSIASRHDDVIRLFVFSSLRTRANVRNGRYYYCRFVIFVCVFFFFSAPTTSRLTKWRVERSEKISSFALDDALRAHSDYFVALRLYT